MAHCRGQREPGVDLGQAGWPCQAHPRDMTNREVKTMLPRRFVPTPLALAALVAAALAAPATFAADPVRAPQAAVKPTGVSRITLSTGIVDGKMVFLDERGQPNPKLKAKVGDTVEITISSGEGAQHDIVIPGLNVASAKLDKSTGAT